MNTPIGDRAAHIQHLAELIHDIDVAMLTTTAPDGRLVSRPLGTQEVEFDGDLWFATGRDSAKVTEILANPQVNVSYASTSRNSYVSVAGHASIIHDRARIDALWSPAMALFFPGGKDDPELCLIKVDVDSAEYWDGPGSFLGKALYIALTAVTDNPASLSENERFEL